MCRTRDSDHRGRCLQQRHPREPQAGCALQLPGCPRRSARARPEDSRRLRTTPGAVKAAAEQFPLGHPAVECVVVGCRSVAQLDESLAMFELDIPPDMWRDLKAEGLLPAEAPTPATRRG